MAEKERGLETLNVWQRAVAFAVHVCRDIVPMLPQEEKWILGSQLRRSSQSIPANIAEGHGCYYYQEGVRFCYLSRGSLEETFTHLKIAHELGYLSHQVYADCLQEIETLRRMLNGYITHLKESKRGQFDPGFQSSLHEPEGPYASIEEEPVPGPLSTD